MYVFKRCTRATTPKLLENRKNGQKSIFSFHFVCRCGLRKTEKIFSANNEQGTIKQGEKWFPEKH